jgi:predicted RNA-binding protein associated with RNAse of E/G family
MVTVINQNHLGEKLLEYSGEVLMAGKTWVCIEATYNNPDKDAGYVVFRHGDTFVEWYYSERWYNVFELYDVDDGQHKGWYCNITRPAKISEDLITADDLALDVFVTPEGEITVLDEDEFAALNLPPNEQRAVRDAVRAIRRAVENGDSPFEEK